MAEAVLVLGDVHASDPEHEAALLAAYEATDADVALQVGDLERYDLPLPTWFVAGNNEDFDVIEAKRGNRSLGADGDNANLLASTVTEISGLRVAGLSGNFAPTQYDKPRSELTGDRRRHFVRADVEAAKDLDDVDVLLTHEAPHGLLSFGYDPGSEPVDELLDALDPALCLVGHYHRHAESDRAGTRVVALAPVWEAYYLLDPGTLTLERFESP